MGQCRNLDGGEGVILEVGLMRTGQKALEGFRCSMDQW